MREDELIKWMNEMEEPEKLLLDFIDSSSPESAINRKYMFLFYPKSVPKSVLYFLLSGNS